MKKKETERAGNVEKFDYQGEKWKRKRAKILRRDGYLCRECRRYGRIRQAAEVHHIKHVTEWPELAWDDRNLISLCKECHNKEHPEKGRKRRIENMPPL